jgi:hypothetical protein
VKFRSEFWNLNQAFDASSARALSLSIFLGIYLSRRKLLSIFSIIQGWSWSHVLSRFDCPHAGRKTKKKRINSLPVWIRPARSRTLATPMPLLLPPPSLHGSSVWRVDARECKCVSIGVLVPLGCRAFVLVRCRAWLQLSTGSPHVWVKGDLTMLN